jgi:DNA-binding response OmpR family regulator
MVSTLFFPQIIEQCRAMTRMALMTLSESDRTKLTQARVLVIDASEGTRRMVCEVLRSAGISQISAIANATEGFDAMRHFDPDVVLLDMVLAGMSGIDMAVTVRQAARTPDPRIRNPRVPLVLLTSSLRERDVVARNAGIDEFILRPFSMTALMKALRAVILRRRPFVVGPTYIGPDRRRRRIMSYEGLLKREADIEAMAESVVEQNTRREISIELVSLKALMSARQGLHRPTLEHAVRQLINAGRKAQEARLSLIAHATQSLTAYCEMFGDAAEPEVINVHLEALIALSDLPPDQIAQCRVEGERIVRTLSTLVKKRHNHRRLAEVSS